MATRRFSLRISTISMPKENQLLKGILSRRVWISTFCLWNWHSAMFFTSAWQMRWWAKTSNTYKSNGKSSTLHTLHINSCFFGYRCSLFGFTEFTGYVNCWEQIKIKKIKYRGVHHAVISIKGPFRSMAFGCPLPIVLVMTSGVKPQSQMWAHDMIMKVPKTKKAFVLA